MALQIFNKYHKDGPKGIDSAAQELTDHITASSDGSLALSGAKWDILSFAQAHPKAIDFPLLVYSRMAVLLPSTFALSSGGYRSEGTLEARVKQLLCYFLQSMVRSIDDGGAIPEPADIGDVKDWDYDGIEYANVSFRRDEVENKLDQVLDKVHSLQRTRGRTITAWAVEGRAHALGVAKIGRGKHAWLSMTLRGSLIPSGSSGRGMPPWSKTDFVAACVGMRATANTILNEMSFEERESELEQWKSLLKEFLLEGEEAADDVNRKFRDGDFSVKYHAAALLRNLVDGPKDETSEDLFRLNQWVL